MQIGPKIERVQQRARALADAIVAAKTAAAEVTAVARLDENHDDLGDYFNFAGTTEPDPGRGITREEYDGMVTSITAIEEYTRTNWHFTNLYRGASQ